ncbi:MAG: prepilin-type N-terminal cleavage/methylation domain-containing protein [Pirellulales bacterium]
MKTYLFKPYHSRQAFTLIELIVVLTILVGLAGVLVPAVTNMVARTSRSTSALNITEIAGTIQRHEAIYLKYPDNLDSLMRNTTGTDLNKLSTSLTAGLVDVTIDVNTLATLANAGITTVGVHALDDTTFNTPTLTALADQFVVKGLLAAKQVALGLETTGTDGKYVVFGIGALSELNGRSMVDAPVHFPRDAASNPNSVYSRFIAVFQITDGTDAITRAKFVGVLAPDGSAMSSELNGYFTSVLNN